MTPEEQAIEKRLQEAIENKKQAVNMAVALSGQLITAALGMIALEGAYIAFAADKKLCGALFWITMAVAFLAFIYSIIRAGKGATALYKPGAEGTWNYALGDRHFQWQTLSCFIGIGLFIFAVLFAQKDKPSESEAAQKQLQTVVQGFEKQAAINQQFLSELQTNQLRLESRMQLYGQQLQSVVQGFEKETQVNQQFLTTLATNQQNAEVRGQLASQQLQSLVQVFEKQAQINQSVLAALQTNRSTSFQPALEKFDQLRVELEQIRKAIQHLEKVIDDD